MTEPNYREVCTHLAPGAARAYEEFHRAVPRRIDEYLRRTGVVSWQIFLRDDVLTHCVREVPVADVAPDDGTALWWHEQVSPFLLEGAKPAVERPFGRLIWELSWPTREDLQDGVDGSLAVGLTGIHFVEHNR